MTNMPFLLFALYLVAQSQCTSTLLNMQDVLLDACLNPGKV